SHFLSPQLRLQPVIRWRTHRPGSNRTAQHDLFMIQTFVLAFLALAIAVGGGTASVWYALDTNESFGAERIGPWTAYPAEGRPDADPYSTARRARNAEL